jgi:hypothetical protein
VEAADFQSGKRAFQAREKRHVTRMALAQVPTTYAALPKILEARGGIEPPIKVLQTFALPLGDRATECGENQTREDAISRILTNGVPSGKCLLVL